MIEIHDVFCLYVLPTGDAVAALRGVSLTVAEGEAVALVGPNGSGKSTLVRVITGEARASAGRVTVAGRTPSVGVRRDLLGIIDQHPGRTLRSELSVVDNVALQLRLGGIGRRKARRRAKAALGDVGLADLGPATTADLADGESHRVAVAAALAHDPRVILADEPTSGLAPDAAADVLATLRRAVAERGASLLLVTHDQDSSAIADRVVRIRDGRISEEWRPGHPERSVVDDRGWLRLPEPERPRMGRLIATASTATGLALTPVGEDPGTDPPAAAVRPALDRADGPLVDIVDLLVTRGGRTLPLPGELRLTDPGVTVVSGPSGSGKSTLLGLLAGLADPDAGEVRIAGRAWGPLDRSARAVVRREWMALVQAQTGVAEDLDAAANLALARQLRGRDAGSDIDVAEALELLDLQALRGRPARVLSGGERQRLILARAIDSGRPLLLLDDPTSQQDEAHAALIARVLHRAGASGRTIVVATHDPLIDAVADQAIGLVNPAPST